MGNMRVCPNSRMPQWSVMVKQLNGSQTEAYRAFIAHGYTIPPVMSELEYRRAIKMTGNRFSGYNTRLIKDRVTALNKAQGTDHKVEFAQVGESDNYTPTITWNYLPKSQSQTRPPTGTNRWYQTMDDYSLPEGQRNKGFETESALGYFNEEGDFLPYDKIQAYPTSRSYDITPDFNEEEFLDEEFLTFSEVVDWDTPMTENMPRNGTPKFQEVINLKMQEVSRLKTALNTLELQLRKKDLSATARETMLSKVGALKTTIADLRADVGAINMITSLEGIIPFAEADMTRLQKLFTTPNAEGHHEISEEDMRWAIKTTNLWKTITDVGNDGASLFWTATELAATKNTNQEFSQAAADLLAKFASWRTISDNYTNDLLQAGEHYLKTEMKEQYGKDTIIGDLRSMLKDIGVTKSLMLDISHIDNRITELIYKKGQDANRRAKAEFDAMNEDLDKLIKEGHITEYSFMQQEFSNTDNRKTGNMISRYTSDYHDLLNEWENERESKLDHAERTYANPATRRSQKAKINKEYFKKIKKISLMLDYRKLFMDSSLYSELDKDGNPISFSQEEIQAHHDLLRNTLGDEEYAKVMEQAEEQIERFREGVGAMKVFFDAKYNNVAESALAYNTWLNENSPYIEARIFYGAQTAATNDSFIVPTKEYSITVARKSVDGKETGFYDEKYKAMRQNVHQSALYDHIMDLMYDLKSVLPAEKANLLHANTLPFMYKDLTEQFIDGGISGGFSSMMENVRAGMKEDNKDPEGYQHKDVYTGKADFKLQTQFIANHNPEIKAYLEYKTIQYRIDNEKENPDTETLKNWRRDIINDIAMRKSFDVGKVIKGFTSMAVIYKHKAETDMIMRIGRNLLYATHPNDDEAKGNQGNRKAIEKSSKIAHVLASADSWMEIYYGYKVEKASFEKAVAKSTKLASKDERKKAEELEQIIEDNEQARSEGKITAEEYAKNFEVLTNQLDELKYGVSGQAAVTGLLGFVQLLNMGYNFTSGASNFGFGLISNFTEASDGRLFTTRDMSYAYSILWKTMGGVNQFSHDAIKIRNLMQRMDILKETQYEISDKTKGDGTMSSFKEKLMPVVDKISPYKLQSSTEYLNQAPLMICILRNTKVEDGHGGEISLWDAMGKDGHLKEEYRTEKNIADIENHSTNKTLLDAGTAVDELIQICHGNYDRLNSRTRVSRYLLGKLFLQFRTWALMGFYTRFGGTQDYHTTGLTRKGRYRSYTPGTLAVTLGLAGTAMLPGVGTVIGGIVGLGAGYAAKIVSKKMAKEDVSPDMNVLQESFFMLKQVALRVFTGKTHFNEAGYSDVDSANLRKNMTEMMGLIAINIMAVLLLRGLKMLPDDEKKKKTSMFMSMNFMLNLYSRLQTDVFFYSNPQELQSLNKNFIPAVAIVNDIATLADAITKAWGGDTKMHSGPFKGENRVWVKSRPLIPGLKMWNRAKTVTSKQYRQGQYEWLDDMLKDDPEPEPSNN